MGSVGELNLLEAQNQNSKLAHPNIYPTSELQELMKGLVLENKSYRISMTQGNSRVSKEKSQ